MAIYDPQFNALLKKLGGFAKPERRHRIKGRRDRTERAHKRTVRAACVERDGYCLVQRIGLGGCKGRSTWAHLAGHRRSQTRGMTASQRHDTRFSAMLCEKHHNQEERNQYGVVYESTRYADGPVRWEPVTSKGQESAA